jgi:uncharacterized membrane protein YphA (DoxX/SURF4 family)
MNKLAMGARLLLGLLYTVFGLNFFLHFIPLPPNPEAANNLLGAFFAAGYLFPFIKITEIVGGVALLSGLFAPLALVVLAPITLNIFAFHLFLAPDGLPVTVLILALHLFLGYANKDKYASILKAK